MINKTMIAVAVAMMFGAAGTVFAQPKSGSASSATPSTPEQDAKLKSNVQNAGKKVKEKARNVMAKVRGNKPAEQPAQARTTDSRAEPARRADDVQSSQTREQRMAEARTNWERTKR